LSNANYVYHKAEKGAHNVRIIGEKVRA